MKKSVIHVYRGFGGSSSRIQMQISWCGGGVIDAACGSYLAFIWQVLVCRADVVIFHGQSSLPSLLIFALTQFFRMHRAKVVYDMHDLHERPLSPKFKAVLRYWIFYCLEFVVARVGFRVVTVSKGLARIYFRRYKRAAHVVYNVAFNLAGIGCGATSISSGRYEGGRQGVVYFGLIKPDRIPVSSLRETLCSGGELIFDVYGLVPKGDFSIYMSELELLSSQTSLRLCGPYKPDAMGFLEKYRYSWLCFESDRLNIRYCMPNKLFQSLSAGLCCVISDRLVEARTLFGDACVSYRDFLRICAGELESPADKIDWKDVEARMQKVAERSRAVFLEVCSA